MVCSPGRGVGRIFYAPANQAGVRGAEVRRWCGTNDPRVWRALGVASSFGLTVALLAVGGVLAGRWADRVLHTAPVGTIVGLLLGLAAGTVAGLKEIGQIGGGPGSRPRP